MIVGIRGLYSPCSKPHGTCFSLDSTTHSLPGSAPSNMMEFERSLAAIIATTQPVSDKRNPFFFNKFYGTRPRGITWTEQSWNCKDSCDAADVLMHPANTNSWAMNHHYPEASDGVQWGPSGVRNDGCKMCQAMFEGDITNNCNNKTSNELMIAFVNGGFDDASGPSPPCMTMNRVMIGTTPASSIVDMLNWVAPNGLAYQV